jgi:hypothetical protein
LRSVDDQDVGETAVIRFRCVFQRIKKFGRHRGMKLPNIVKDFSTVDLKGNEDKILRSSC